MSFIFLLFFFNEKAFGTLGAGGPLSDIQANMDVKNLYLSLKVDPTKQEISGFAEWDVVLKSSDPHKLEWDLFEKLKVSRVSRDGQDLNFEQKGHKLWVALGEETAAKYRIRIEYQGTPLEAARPPWRGGFTWAKTDQNNHWIAVSCQGEGAKVWFPAKDQMGDKIEGMRLDLTVPEGLFAAANGLLIERTKPAEGWETFRWESQYPISPYNISFGIAEYGIDKDVFKDEEERETPVVYYFLKEHQKADQIEGDTRDFQTKRRDLIKEFKRYLSFYSRFYGPFPFYEEKAGIVQTPYLGMEHQTINAYGNNYKMKDGYDWLLLHELGHEWWGNKVSVHDWRDFWIHEGICTYSTAVFLEETQSLEKAQQYLAGLRKTLSNTKPILGKPQATTTESYSLDVYYKGALMLHSLRFLVGKKALDGVLKTFAMNPSNTYLHPADTEGFIEHAEQQTGRELDWFFDQYLKKAALPQLSVNKVDQQLQLSWDSATFEMPIEVRLIVEGETRFQRLPMTKGKAELTLPKGAQYHVDPNNWVLKSAP